MKALFKNGFPLLAILLSASVVFAQSYPQSRSDDGQYNDRRYENNSRYNDSRYYDNDWFEMDRIRISGRDNYERIHIARRYGGVRQLWFKTDGAVKIYRVAVRYSDGRMEELRMHGNRRIRYNRYNSRGNDVMVSIPKRRRAEVREISFWYDSQRRSFWSRPEVLVLAK